MKHLFIITLFLFACKKEPETKETIKTNTVFKSCSQLRNTTFDSNGNIQASTVFYYTGNRLDSAVSFNPLRCAVFIYEYTDFNTRKAYTSFPVNNGSYSIQTLNDNGEVIESKGYNANEKLIYWSTSEYKCQ
jgi:hypothetical protein